MSDDKTEEDPAAETTPSEKRRSSEKGVPSHLRMDFSKNEGAATLRPGFRNPGNKNSKAQKRKKKGRKR